MSREGHRYRQSGKSLGLTRDSPYPADRRKIVSTRTRGFGSSMSPARDFGRFASCALACTHLQVRKNGQKNSKCGGEEARSAHYIPREAANCPHAPQCPSGPLLWRLYASVPKELRG